MRLMKLSLVLFMAGLVGCASSHVLVGTQRPPIDASQVMVYLQPPVKFEQVAILEASSAGSPAFTSQQKTNKVMARLKQEAAALGANGILLQGVGNQSGGAVVTSSGTAYGGGYTGTGIAVPVMHKSGSAIAIYVQP